MRCPQCKCENPTSAGFCGKCGTRLEARCESCGAGNPPGNSFCHGCGTALAVATASVLGVSQDSGLRAPGEAERRQLTVMFCDLVGSTALSARLDPEDLREVVRAYQTACAEVIARFDGHIAQYLGDGLLVYFGYPQAHEDDAHRAIRSGLGIVESIARLSAGADQPLAVRVGIHTGPVVVGQVGGGGRHEQLALGETPNVAARLQALAEPGRVVISAASQRLVEGFFAVRELGLQVLKGTSAPVKVFEVVEASAARTRLDIATPVGSTRLVGREQEVGLLLDRWERVCEGHGQVVLLTGEPGIGKSRLVQMVKERVAAGSHRRVEARCSPYYDHTPLYPVTDLLPRVFEWSRSDGPAEKLAKLEKYLTRHGVALPETMPLLAALLSLPAPESHPLPPMSAEREKRTTLEAVLALLLAMAAEHPVLLIVEDLHWVDPTTLELLTLLVDQGPTARILALFTFRPDFIPPWMGRGHLTQVTVNRLPGRQVVEVIRHVAHDKALPPEVVEQIVVKTDGVPLFVEELTKMVLESELLQEREDRYEVTGPLPSLTIPATLHDSLMARLDRLAVVKNLAQLGATLGRGFSYALLQAVSPWDEQTVQRGLQQLVEAEFLYQRGLPPQATYFFKHALIQDAAYQSLLKSTRQQYHQRIVRVLEERFLEVVETQPELLAHHCTEAGMRVEAIPYWQRAGERAIGRLANVEAIHHLRTALELLGTLPHTAARARQELDLQTTLGPAVMAVQGYAATEAGQIYARARELCQELGETAQLFSVLRGLHAFYFTRGELQTARELGEQCLASARRVQHSGPRLGAHFVLGLTHCHLGMFVQSREHLEQGIALYDARRRPSSRVLQDPGVACLAYTAMVLWPLGYPDLALERSQEAISLSQELLHPFSVVFALTWAAIVHHYRQETQAAQERAEAVITLAQEQGFGFYSAQGTIVRGWALTEQGHGEEGLAQLRQGLIAYSAAGAEVGRPAYLAILAAACRNIKQTELGLAALAEAFAGGDKSGERWYEAEQYRLKGELLQQQTIPDESQVETCFQQALAVARRQHAKSWELRAATSLGRLWQRQGKQADARALLTPVHGWFTEGFDTSDLKDAKALLDELA